MQRTICTVLTAALVFCVSAVTAAPQDAAPEWVVISIVGKWRVAGSNTPIAFGAALKPGASVESDPPGASTGSLTVLAGTTPVTYACNDPKTLPNPSKSCRDPLSLQAAAPDGQAGAPPIFADLPNLLSRDPNRYYSAVSSESGNLEDAVVRRTGNSVDLKPALQSLSKGEYRLIVERLDPGKPAAPLSNMPPTLRWNPESKQPASGPDLSPGLYHLQMETVDHQPAGDAWILVTEQQDYKTKSAALAEVERITSTWKSTVPAAGIRAVNRAALDQLSP
jgi:hypothetical protein